jgi:hypothetical protein
MAERNALTKDEFEAATDVYLVDKKDKEDPKPDTWEEGKYFGTPAPDAASAEDDAANENAGEGNPEDSTTDKSGGPPEGGSEQLSEGAKTVKESLLDTLLILNGKKTQTTYSNEDAIAGAAAFCEVYKSAIEKGGETPPNEEEDGGEVTTQQNNDGKGMGGGRRRSKRRYGKKGAKKSKKSGQSSQSQNGGRRSRKNRRKYSHRRKH